MKRSPNMWHHKCSPAPSVLARMQMYLFQVREREGVDAADGIDTLLVYLLAELDDDSRLASFAEGPQQVTPDVVAGLLQRKGQSDTLAQLYAAAGQPAAGLALWKVSPCVQPCSWVTFHMTVHT